MQSSAPAPIPVATLSLVFKVLHNAVQTLPIYPNMARLTLRANQVGDLDRVLPQ